MSPSITSEGDVAKVKMVTSIVLIGKVLIPSISTPETPSDCESNQFFVGMLLRFKSGALMVVYTWR
jgi:hypothetical protein